MHHPLRLTVEKAAIQSNWRWLAERAGVAAGAAVKADGYGLGARETAEALIEAGCRDFFVSTWAEAEALGNLPESVGLVVLHGVGPDDARRRFGCRRGPASIRAEQVARWKEIAPDRPCDVMIDTGMNRLGLRPTEIGALDGLDDRHAAQPSRLRRRGQRDERDAAGAFSGGGLGGAGASATAWPTARASALAATTASTSSGRACRSTAAFPRAEAEGNIRQVARVEAQIVQRRTIPAGESCGYGATFIAQ